MEVPSRGRSKSNSNLAAGGRVRRYSEGSPAKGNEARAQAERRRLGECPDSNPNKTCHFWQRFLVWNPASNDNGSGVKSEEVYLGSRIPVEGAVREKQNTRKGELMGRHEDEQNFSTHKRIC